MRSSSKERKEKEARGSASWKTPLPRLSSQQLLPGRTRSDDFEGVEDQSGAGPSDAVKSVNTQSIQAGGSSFGVFSGEDTVTAARPPSTRSPVASDMATSFYTSASPGDSPRTSSEQIPLSEIHPALRPRPDEETPVMIPATLARRDSAALPYVTLTANRLDPNVDRDLYGRRSSTSSRISIPRTSSRQSITPTNASVPSPTFFGVPPSLRLTTASSQASFASSASSDTMATRRHEGRSTPTQPQIGLPSSPTTSRPSSRGSYTSKYAYSITPFPLPVKPQRSSAQSMQDSAQRVSGERVERLRSTSSPITPSSPVFETARETVPQFQYPVIRSPSVSSGFAGMSASELPTSPPPRSSAAPASRASTRKRLSTVLSTVEPIATLESLMPEKLEYPSPSRDGGGALGNKDPQDLPGSHPRTADSDPTTPRTSHFASDTSGISMRSREVDERSAFLTQPPPLRYLPQPAQRQTWLEDTPAQESVTLVRESVQWPLRPSRPMTPYADPHLPPDRKETARWSTWTTPSIDEALGSRSNRQILLFCLGFICPLVWMIAALLPLPTPEAVLRTHTPDTRADRRHVTIDDNDMAALRRYLKARWWRKVNRYMSVVGLGVIGAIIALAIVASRT